jgi:hypothetical protein
MLANFCPALDLIKHCPLAAIFIRVGAPLHHVIMAAQKEELKESPESVKNLIWV